jgi:arylsulfatase
MLHRSTIYALPRPTTWSSWVEDALDSSIRIRGHWRVCFAWLDRDAYDSVSRVLLEVAMPFRLSLQRLSKAQRLLGMAAIVLVGLGLGLAYLFLVPRGSTALVPQAYDFLEHFPEAEVRSPGPDYVGIHDDFIVSDGPERALYAHPDTQVTYHGLSVYEQGRIELAIGMHRDTWDKPGDGVLFEVLLTDSSGKEHSLFSRHLDPGHNEGDRGWQPISIDLSPFAGQQVSLTFSTKAGKNPMNDWAAWSQPRLVSEKRVPVGLENQPNVVLISIDTLRADHVSAYGYDRPTTPRLDQLSREGVLFEQAYCQVVITLPSHATMLTSLYARTHGLYYNSENMLAPEVRTVAEILKEHGYSTAAVVGAKFLMPQYSGLGQGFDTFSPFPEAADPKAQRPAEEVTALARSWIEEHYREKFFLFVHYYDPHTPYLPPAPYTATLFYEGNPYDPDNHSLDKVSLDQRHGAGLSDDVTDLAYPIALYDAEIAYTDDQVGELLDLLDLLDLADNTLVIVVSDHGESFGEHGIYFDHWTLYDDTLHVPLIMRYPGHLPAGQRISSLVEAGVDIVPTALDLLALPPLPEAEGQTLVPLVEGQQEPRFAIFSEQREAMAVAIRTEQYKFILDRVTSNNPLFSENPLVEGKRELYDLRRDPGEHQNLLTGEGAPSRMGDEFASICQEWLAQKSVQVQPAKGELTKELQEILKDLGY